MKTTTLKFFGIPAVAALALFGCEKNDVESDGMKVAKPVVTQIAAVCDDHSLKNRLSDSLQAALLDASLARLSGLSELQMQDMETKVRSKLSSVAIDLQNVANVEGGCVADVYLTPQATDLAAAETLFAESQMPLAQRAEQAGVQIIAGRLVAQGFSYQIVDNKAVLGEEHPAVALLADVLVAAASVVHTQTPDESNEQMANIAAPTVSVRPEAVVKMQENQIVSAAPISRPAGETVSRPAREQATRSQQPRAERVVQKDPSYGTAQKEQPRRNNDTPTPKRREQAVQNKPSEPKKSAPVAAAKEEAKTDTLVSEQTKQIVKSEPKVEKTEPKAEAKAEPKSEHSPKPAPKAEPKKDIAPTAQPSKQAAPAQITIVETGETY